MAFILQERFDALPVIWADGTRDGSSLVDDKPTLAWLISNDFRRVSHRYKGIAACDVHGEELLERLRKYFGKGHPYTKKVSEEGIGTYCRMLSPYNIINVPKAIFKQLRVAR